MLPQKSRQVLWKSCPASLVNLGYVQPPPFADDAPVDGGLLARLELVAGQMSDAALASGRDAGAVRLMLATKTIEPARILPALAAGYRLIGENRVQELVSKAPELATTAHECHFIGHL